MKGSIGTSMHLVKIKHGGGNSRIALLAALRKQWNKFPRNYKKINNLRMQLQQYGMKKKRQNLLKNTPDKKWGIFAHVHTQSPMRSRQHSG